MQPLLSDEEGFPRRNGLPPYVSCLAALEECPLVIGIVDREYGTRFKDWGSHKGYEGLSPTHAELRHALDRKKKVLLYIHQDTLNFYEMWRKGGLNKLPKGLDEGTLALLKELKLRAPAPWIESFSNGEELIRSLQKNLVNELYSTFREQEKQSTDLARYILDLISAAPDAKSEIEQQLNPELRSQLASLQRKLEELEAERRLEQAQSRQRLEEATAAKQRVEQDIEIVKSDLDRATAHLVAAAIKDVRWLELVRTRLMPKQPGRVPFHNDAEVAFRGYHCSNLRGAPVLTEVSWSKLSYRENNLHRGYRAGLIFRGRNFAPGVTFASRDVGDTEPPVGWKDYWWRFPNIYFGDYLEVSTHDDELEGPLGYRRTEFCVRNPQGECSEWIRFSYPFDEPRLRDILSQQQELGELLYNEWRFGDAIEPLRKAYVFSDRLDGAQHERTRHLHTIWNNAIDGATLLRCRFREGDRVKVVRGDHTGAIGVVEILERRYQKPYLVRPDAAEPAARPLNVGDDEVEAANV
jgi:hypothetical protein